jgi:DNA-binding transcriptional MerR regulator
MGKLPPNVSYRKYYYWIEQGAVPGESKPGRGRGRHVDRQTYRLLFALSRLRDMGFELKQAATIAHILASDEAWEKDSLTMTLDHGISVTIELDTFFAGITGDSPS